MSQDRIVGNQQRAGVFWERISDHYDEHRPTDLRPQRSLETKWGNVKHDMSKFIGIYAQVQKVCRSGTSATDTLKRAHELNRLMTPRGADFSYEHVWVLVKEHPKWADGWSQVKPPIPKRKARGESEQESDCIDVAGMARQGSGVGSGSGVGLEMEDGVNAEGTRVFNGRPGGTKAAKEDQIRAKQREAAVYAQAAATDKMAEAQMLKAVGLQDQNMLLLMTTDDATLTNTEAREYIQLRRVEELRKLRRRLAEDNEQELVRQADCARRVEAAAAVAAAEEVQRPAVGELPGDVDNFRGGINDLRDCVSDSQEHGD